MQRAGHERPVSIGEPTRKPPVSQSAGTIGLRLVGEVPATLSAADKIAAQRIECEELESTIRQRIESRLQGRVRNLRVRATTDIVILEGECATFYTKQIAQHAAMGVLDDEQLENAIVVNAVR